MSWKRKNQGICFREHNFLEGLALKYQTTYNINGPKKVFLTLIFNYLCLTSQVLQMASLQRINLIQGHIKSEISKNLLIVNMNLT